MEHASLTYSRPLVICCLVIFRCFWYHFTAPTKDSESLDTAGVQDDDNAIRTVPEESRPDEDINEEIVDDANVLAKVTLPSRICQLQLFTIHRDRPKMFVQIDDGPWTMPRSSFSNLRSKL